jgi:hypothetical protein
LPGAPRNRSFYFSTRHYAATTCSEVTPLRTFPDAQPLRDLCPSSNPSPQTREPPFFLWLTVHDGRRWRSKSLSSIEPRAPNSTRTGDCALKLKKSLTTTELMAKADRKTTSQTGVNTLAATETEAGVLWLGTAHVPLSQCRTDNTSSAHPSFDNQNKSTFAYEHPTTCRAGIEQNHNRIRRSYPQAV